ncbi:TerD family protein [Rudaeicoccus suwonensis]|uniref:Tellurium resistance protein TerD n=1 Tax=Rudaeicoccus suwonensis TaxID=657409 RepID=A0A561E0W5_9MICO|nr:TerD family protein [Rudaeicoccus suwonensis]TWE09232.1 tellurium resistance protein TerD [Rudaeicoccus suwonensis]
MTVSTKGANAPLIGVDGAPSRVVLVGVNWANAQLDVDLCGLMCDENQQVLSDAHFLFWSNPLSPEGVAMLRTLPPGSPSPVADRAQLVVNVGECEPRVAKILITMSTQVPGKTIADAGRTQFRVVDLDSPQPSDVMTYVNTEGYSSERCVIAVELYRRGGGWKARIVDQGYADGLAALARHHNVSVED